MYVCIYVESDSFPLGVADFAYNVGITQILEVIRNEIKRDISSFEPFKSPDPDGIFPAILQHAGCILYEHLVLVYEDCHRRCNIPCDYVKDKSVESTIM